MSEHAAAKSGFVAGLTGLQKLTLGLAAAVSLTGAGLWAYAATTSPAPSEGPVHIDQGGGDDVPPGYSAQGLTDGDTAGAGAREAELDPGADKTALELYTPALFRLGFAFFVGFAIAFAARAALKVVLIVAGAVLLLLIGLQMAGLVTVNWSAMDGMYQSAGAWLAEQTRSFAAFVRGYIPSGATALTGFGVGFLKKR
ncbi:MAG TPA: FUN14 domain-containing protein [Phycisphaerales bacterium]|nr:FUN14 domain-containing protein [Phycisphaerales bacterium]